MSHSLNGPTTRIQVRDRFPSAHIQAFGTGMVDLVYVTFNASGKIILAEAELHDAPFGRMIIDDPNILRIFGERGDKIDLDILHPWPRFRLDPMDTIPVSGEDPRLWRFEVGRLVDITHLPASARFGSSLHNLAAVDPLEEGAVHKSIRQAVERAAEAKRPRGRNGCTSIAPTRSSTRKRSISARPLPEPVLEGTKEKNPISEESELLSSEFLREIRRPSTPRPLPALTITNIVGDEVSSNGFVRATAATSSVNPVPNADKHRGKLLESETPMSNSTPPRNTTVSKPAIKTPVPLPPGKISGRPLRALLPRGPLPPPQVIGKTPRFKPVEIPKPRRRDRNKIVPDGPHKEKVQQVVNDIFFLLLDPAAREQYTQYIEIVRKDVAREPLLKVQFHAELEEFVRHHDIVELHNQYAVLTRTGSNKIYQLPMFAVESQPTGQ